MDEGVIVEQGAPADVMSSPSTERFAAFLKRYEYALGGAPR
jgi:ABC-type histidine transport system ATPase subunit